MTRPSTSFTEEYMEQCKVFWYQAGRPILAEVLDDLPTDRYGKRPSLSTLKVWRINRSWDFWADEVDARAIVKVEDSLVLEKAEMLRRHAEVAKTLMEKGAAFLESEDGGFDSSSSAVQAIIKGAELERVSRGIGDLIVKMAQMSDDQVKDKILDLVARASENNQIVEGEEIPEKSDTESTEE